MKLNMRISKMLPLHNMPYLDYCRPGKKSLTNVGLLASYLWIYLKCMAAYLWIDKLKHS